jgi:hypothetical protein
MTSQIKQVSIQELNGGMQYDKDARRIPNKAFQNLVNAEYNKRGKLVKSKGYDSLPVVCSGDVKDVQKIIDTSLASVGFLIAEGNTRFVSALTALPTQDHSFARARSKFLRESSGRMFYISDDGTGNARTLRRWYYDPPYGVDLEAGIPPVTVRPYLSRYLADTEIAHCTVFDNTNNDNSFKIALTTGDNYIQIDCGLNHPTLRVGNKFNKIVVPIKACAGWSGNRTLYCSVGYIGDSINQTTTTVITEASTRVEFTFSEPIDLLRLGSGSGNVLRITIMPNTNYSATEYVTFYRAQKWLIDSEEVSGVGTTRIYSTSVGNSTHTDREIVLGLVLSNANLVSGDYYYETLSEDTLGRRSNILDPIYKTKETLDATYLKLTYALIDTGESEPIEFFDLSANPSLIRMVPVRTMVEGGTFYEVGSFLVSKLIYYGTNMSFTSETTPWTASGYTGQRVVGPKSYIDSRVTAIPANQDYAYPLSLNPLMYSLTYFRNRAWVLARITDAMGVVATFLRYSEVDVYDYFDPLSELGIPDDIIETQALREDSMLSWSRTKTYLITPVGTGFEWLKIADTGIGGSSMASTVGTSEASRFSCATNDAIYWINERGAYKYDGSSVTHLPMSIQVLSLILEAIAADAVFMSVEKDWAVWLSWSNKILVLDFLNQAIVSQLRSKTIISTTEDGSSLYLGYLNGIAQRSADWAEEATALVSTIITKRFASDDLKRIQLYYFGMTYRVKASGSLTLVFEFSTGKTVTKTLDLTVGDNDLETTYLEVYGEGSWFQITMTHSTNIDFEIIDYVLGATPEDMKFMGEE